MQTKKKSRLLILLVLAGTLCLAAGGYLSWRWYDNTVDRSGWVMQHDQYYYRDFHNHTVTGWQEIDGSRYYFDPEGVMQTGWLPLDQELYYLDTDGTMYTGWLHHHNQDYYLQEDGTVATGLLPLDGELFLLDADGHRLSGLQTVDGLTYYFTEEGPAASGAVSLPEGEYYFGEDFTQQTGWVDIGEDTFYYLPEGKIETGLQEIDGKIYNFSRDGSAVHGWSSIGEYEYYFGKDGAALTGPQEIDGQKHYFTPKGIHVVLVNASNPIPDYYKPDPVILTEWHQISRIALEPMQRMLKDCREAGNEVVINSIYRSHESQEEIVEKRTNEHMAEGLTYEEAYEKTLETAAYPGTSEHEMGLAADLVGEDANKWLAEHCWEYGFILRYPPDKFEITGITYEPWHFRYVGTEVSMDMKDSGLCLEEYLGTGPAVPEHRDPPPREEEDAA